MPYAAPARWIHGDEVTAAKLNIYSTDLAFFNTVYAGKNAHFATMQLAGERHTSYFIVHRYRWLWFRGEGRLDKFGPAPQDGTDLSSGNVWAMAMDLDSVAFLHYGDQYLITGVTFAFEDLQP